MLSAAFIMKVLVSKKLNHSALKSAVFISSNLSDHGAKGLSAYGASKGGLDTLMKCLAIELAPNVRVNSVLPGAIRTPMTESVFNNKSVIERMEPQYPLGFASAIDIYQAVNFLLSEKSSKITGHQLVVDGGRAVNIA
jgi:NAD(P)-dependent dehydrogenase (short-subunit alcohol dehydrogenase family)